MKAALVAFLPVLWRTFPGMPVLAQVGLGLVAAALAGYVEHYKNVKPALELEAKRTFLFDYVCQPKLAALREHDPTALDRLGDRPEDLRSVLRFQNGVRTETPGRS